MVSHARILILGTGSNFLNRMYTLLMPRLIVCLFV